MITLRRAVLAIAVFVAVPSVAGAQTLFDFHSGFWMNLHHYLHALGRAQDPLVEELPTSASAREREQWQAAVDFYRTRFGKRRLVFDEMLVGIKQHLIAADEGGGLADTTLTPEHRQILERAAPIYRAHAWPNHDAANKRFVSRVQSLVERHGRAIAERLARSYDDTWPVDGLRVDVVCDAGPPGNAYTTNVPRPTHITIGADDQGLMSLEIVFHEASHHWDQRLMKAVNDVAKHAGLDAPPNLWHAILFYNAGRITAEVLADSGITSYELYMVNGKVFALPGWHEALARHWPAFLHGTSSRDEAISRILRDLQRPPG